MHKVAMLLRAPSISGFRCLVRSRLERISVCTGDVTLSHLASEATAGYTLSMHMDMQASGL